MHDDLTRLVGLEGFKVTRVVEVGGPVAARVVAARRSMSRTGPGCACATCRSPGASPISCGASAAIAAPRAGGRSPSPIPSCRRASASRGASAGARSRGCEAARLTPRWRARRARPATRLRGPGLALTLNFARREKSYGVVIWERTSTTGNGGAGTLVPVAGSGRVGSVEHLLTFVPGGTEVAANQWRRIAPEPERPLPELELAEEHPHFVGYVFDPDPELASALAAREEVERP